MAEQNSIDAYIGIQDELGEKQRTILGFIENHPDCTYNDICRALGWRTNTVTARIKELRDKGYIIKSGDKQDKVTGHTNGTYKLRTTEPIDVPKKPKKEKHVLSIKKEHLDSLIAMIDLKRNLFENGFSSVETLMINTPKGRQIYLTINGDGYAILTTPDKSHNGIIFNDIELTIHNINQIKVADSQEFVIVYAYGASFKLWIE